LRNLDSGQTLFLVAKNWSTNSFISGPVAGLPIGYTLVTVFVNGIPSTAGILNLTLSLPTPATLTGAQILTNGSFQFSFTNNPGTLFDVLTTTNISLPLSNWTVVGGVTETSPGRYRFNDTQATNRGQRFYRVRSR